jgi:hypothetical protein
MGVHRAPGRLGAQQGAGLVEHTRRHAGAHHRRRSAAAQQRFHQAPACQVPRRADRQHLAEVLGMRLRRVLAKAKANAMGLKKSKALIAETARERTCRPEHGSRATQFKPGMRPHTWVPVGSYRIVEGPVLERKVNDLPGLNAVRWKPVSRVVWEAGC